MRKLMTTGFVLALALVSANLFAQTKIAVIDPDRIASEAKEGKRIQSVLKGFHEQKQGEITAREAEIRAMEEKLKDPKISDEKKEELQSKYTAKMYEYQAFGKAAQEEMEGRQGKALGELQEKINGIVTKYATAKGFTLVLMKRFCVYSADALDITTDIIAEMDKAYPGVPPGQ